jgi:NAD(P)-dependent dehydrogenase (short-subunit alcohol dehydrogenase family)
VTGGSVAVVTGGARGIGRATALALGSVGYRVVVADVDDSGGRATAAAVEADGSDARFVHTDMTDGDAVDGLMQGTVAAYGAVDLLVNNAAVTRVTDLFDVTVEQWDEILDVNARGYFLALQAAARHMRAQGGGCILNIASVAGKGWRETTNIAYASSKGAVVTMTRIAAASLGRFGIRVNAICPGMTRTEMMQGWIHDRALAEGVSEDELVRRFTASVALGRLVEPAEVAAAVVFLAAPVAGAITGQSLNVDGGLVWD